MGCDTQLTRRECLGLGNCSGGCLGNCSGLKLSGGAIRGELPSDQNIWGNPGHNVQGTVRGNVGISRSPYRITGLEVSACSGYDMWQSGSHTHRQTAVDLLYYWLIQQS